jgi:hypothetical protein
MKHINPTHILREIFARKEFRIECRTNSTEKTNSRIAEIVSPRKNNVRYLGVDGRIIQPFPDLRKGCFPRKITQVEFHESRNFPKYLRKKELISKYIIKHPLLSDLLIFIPIYFLRD